MTKILSASVKVKVLETPRVLDAESRRLRSDALTLTSLTQGGRQRGEGTHMHVAPETPEDSGSLTKMEKTEEIRLTMKRTVWALEHLSSTGAVLPR